jgi:GDP-L-fucose synthase
MIEGDRTQSVFVAGHAGMVGSAVVRELHRCGFHNLILVPRRQLDLTRQTDVEQFFNETRPDTVVVAAARVGGILANVTEPAEFIYQNLTIAVNTIQAAWKSGVNRLLYLGSTCAYPALAQPPIQESSLLGGPLENSNEAYAVAKIAGIKLCQYYRQQYGVVFHSVMPTNLYGQGDRYDSSVSHVIPSLICRFHEGKRQHSESVTIWGTGEALREFLDADDLARAIVCLMSLTDPPDLVNVGSGDEISIRKLAALIADVVGFEGSIVTDQSRPEGVRRKLADTSIMRSLGWKPQVSLKDGIKKCYNDFLTTATSGRSQSDTTQ